MLDLKWRGRRDSITLVRQSANQRTIPEVLLPSEINRLAYSLRNREKTLVLLAAGTGLRMSELFSLKWQDVDFAGKQVSVLRSIVKQSVGPCKTEASQKRVPLHIASSFGPNSSCLASYCPLPSTDGLGFRQSSPPGEVSVLGTGPLATLHPAGCGEGGNHQANRLAYFSAFVFNVAEGKWPT
jgi:hypothetical protein